MVESPIAGFTGVVWEARPTDQLARDLTTGPGPAPLADSAAAWTRLAASFGAAVADYDQIIGAIRDHWRSGTSDAVLQRIATMRDWLVEAAAEAGRNAVHAADQATAYEVAALAMPHISEIAALQAAQKSIQAAGAALGSPLIAAAAQISADTDAAKASAARVMRSYESATEPLAQPWSQTRPPVLTTGAALAAEQVAAQQASVAAAAMPSMPAMPMMPVMPELPPIELPPVLTDSRVQTIAQVQDEHEIAPVQASEVHADANAGQMLPGAAPGAAPAGDDRDFRAGSAVAGYTGDASHFEAGFDTAPPVLGGAAVPVQSVPVEPGS